MVLGNKSRKYDHTMQIRVHRYIIIAQKSSSFYIEFLQVCDFNYFTYQNTKFFKRNFIVVLFLFFLS